MMISRLQTLLRQKYDCCVVGHRKKIDDDEKEESSLHEELFRCNICGKDADFIVQLELIKERSNYNIVESVNQMPFFLCEEHEYLYKRMQNNIELKDYFAETIKENQ
jgi:hypothetical protein